MYKYCSFCGTPYRHEMNKESYFFCLNCKNKVFLNSKPSACGAYFSNNRILLVKSDNKANDWDLPGGFLLYGEDPKDGLIRELYEELSVGIQIIKFIDILVDVYPPDNEFTLNIFYLIELNESQLKPGNEINEFGFFSFDKLPYIRFESTKKIIEKISKT